MVARFPDLVDTVPFGAGGGEEDDGEARPRPASYGKFIALDVIGRGGMGVVLRARDPDLDRIVALKLLAPERWRGTADSIGVPELQREGQALAKLSHPNVVTIYEMGRVGEQTFIAMELIEGVTLRAWLHERARSWRDILHAFLACGRGLAAAHAAGLVHRDFKPENVLIGGDGRPRVTDFGLVTSGVAADDGAEVGDGGELTVRGAIVGTPAYMAPEQWTGDAVDARTDQFAFCVALWEALGGRRPFGGSSTAELRHAVTTAAPRELPRSLPRAVKTILLRGLARDRAARWPSMDALLDALVAVLRGRRVWWLVAAGVATVAAGAVVVAMPTRREADRCAGAGLGLTSTWNPAIRQRVEQAFRAAGVAGDAARVAHAIDTYATRWSEVSVAACRTSRDRTLSPALVDGRAICLADRGRALGKLVEVLVTADRAIARRSLDAIARLPALDACEDLQRLGAITSLPDDPALRRTHDALRVRLAEIEALRLRGDHAAAQAATEAAVAEARALAHPPTLAIALLLLGDLRRDGRALAEAEEAYKDAALAAAEGHDDVGAARAWIRVLFVASEQREHLDAAAVLDPVAEAAVRRAGDPAELRYGYLNASGVLAARREDFATAHARFTEAIAVTSNPAWRAEAMSNRARVVSQRDGAAAALDLATEAAAAVEAANGTDHPDTADALYFVAALTNAVGRPAEAGPRFERARAIHERVFGHDNLNVADDLVGLGNVASRLHDYAAARAHFEEAIAIERRLDAPAAQRAMTLAALAGMLGDSAPAEALPYYEASIALLAATAGPASIDYLGMSMSHAQALKTLDRCAEAAAILTRIDAPMAAHPYLHPDALLVAAQCDRRGGRARPAIATLERALALCTTHACDPLTQIAVQWELGTLVAEAGRDRPRGRALVETARAAMLALDPDDPLIAAGDAWLRQRPR